MLIKKIYKPLLLLSLVFQGCNDFEDLNTNPNEPTAVSSGVLFSSAIRNSAQTQSNESFLLGNNIAQLSAKTIRAEVDFYGWNAFPTVWEGFYESQKIKIYRTYMILSYCPIASSIFLNH